MALTKVSSNLVADDAIVTGKIADGGVGTADLAANAITTAKIAQNNVTAHHISDGSVTTTQLGADAVTAAKVADDAISEEHLDKTIISDMTAVTPVAGDFVLLGDTSDSNNLKKSALTLLLNSNVDLSTKLNLSGGTMTGTLAMGANNITSSGTITGTLATAAQTNITSLGTLTALTVDDITINGSAITVGAFGNTARAATFHGGSMLVDGGAASEIIIGDGNVAYMSIQTTDDATAMKIRNFTGSADLVTIERATGSVGIGTTDPASYNSYGDNLVVATSAHTGISIVAGTTSQSTIMFADGTGGTAGYRGRVGYDHNTDSMVLHTAAAEQIRIDSSGNVGIRNNSPVSLNSLGGNSLVIGDGTQTNNLYLYSATTGGTVGYGHIAFADSNANGSSAQYAGLIQYYHGDNSMAFYTGSAKRMLIDSSGKVGIGTASPNEPLTVRSSAENINCTLLEIGNDLHATNTKDAWMKFVCGAATSDNSWAIGAYPGSFRFSYLGTRGTAVTTAANEKMRITSDGYLWLRNTTANYDGGQSQMTSASTCQTMYVSNTSFADPQVVMAVERGASSAYKFFNMYSGRRPDNGGGDVEFQIRGDGNGYCDGSWSGGGADYAEYFEWSDGNASSQDRIGLSVVLDGNKIREATGSDAAGTIIGVISGNPAVVGDTAYTKWIDKYQKDDYGRYVLDSDGHRQENSDYNDSLTYVERENRKEWDTVGLMGKLRMKKGQQTGTNWIKMRDISASVEEWLVR